jgi:hypothetical protein
MDEGAAKWRRLGSWSVHGRIKTLVASCWPQWGTVGVGGVGITSFIGHIKKWESRQFTVQVQTLVMKQARVLNVSVTLQNTATAAAI